jgi:hypothetical protein
MRRLMFAWLVACWQHDLPIDHVSQERRDEQQRNQFSAKQKNEHEA